MVNGAQHPHDTPSPLQDIQRIFVEIGRAQACEDDPTKNRDDIWLRRRAKRIVRLHLRTIHTGVLDAPQVQALAQESYVEGWRCEKHALRTVPHQHSQIYVWAVGYRDPAGVALLATAESSNCTLFVDIRDRPVSPYQPQWSRKRLRQRFGRRRYRHLRALGNRNHHNDALPISLRDEEAGFQCLVDWVQAGWNIVLICACRDREHCHGTLVLHRLLEHLPQNGHIVGCVSPIALSGGFCVRPSDAAETLDM